MLARDKQFENLISVFNDEQYLYVIQRTQEFFLFRIFDRGFTELRSFRAKFMFNNHVRPCVDKDCIYLPTLDGIIVLIDKFSGDQLGQINMGSLLITADLRNNEHNIFALCLIPLSNGRKVTSKYRAICILDKHNLSERIQTQAFTISHDFLLDDKLYISDSDRLYYFTTKGVLLDSFDIDSPFDYAPIVCGSMIYCSRRDGTLEGFQQRKRLKLVVARNNVSPLRVRDQLFWPASDGIYHIQGEKIEKVVQYDLGELTSATHQNSNIYCLDTQGQLGIFNINDITWETKQLNSDSNSKVRPCNGDVYVMHNNRVTLVEDI
jgi:hypothetical protein